MGWWGVVVLVGVCMGGSGPGEGGDILAPIRRGRGTEGGRGQRDVAGGMWDGRWGRGRDRRRGRGGCG